MSIFLLALNKQHKWKGLLKPICRQSVQHLTPQDVTSFETSHRNFMFGQWKPRTSHLPRKLVTHLLFHLTELLFKNMLQPSAKWSESHPLFWTRACYSKDTSQNGQEKKNFPELSPETTTLFSPKWKPHQLKQLLWVSFCMILRNDLERYVYVGTGESSFCKIISSSVPAADERY